MLILAWKCLEIPQDESLINQSVMSWRQMYEWVCNSHVKSSSKTEVLVFSMNKVIFFLQVSLVAFWRLPFGDLPGMYSKTPKAVAEFTGGKWENNVQLHTLHPPLDEWKTINGKLDTIKIILFCWSQQLQWSCCDPICDLAALRMSNPHALH